MLRGLGWVVGVLVIALALSAALAQVLLPLLARHPQWVAAQLSGKFHRQVRFAALEGRWEPSGPRFVMRDFAVAQEGDNAPLQVPEVDLKLDFGGWLFPSRHLLNLQARGLELDLSRDADGGWHINGFGVAGGGAQRQDVSFGNLSVELWLDDLRVKITDMRLNQQYTLFADQLRITHQGKHVRVGARLHRLGASGQLQAAGRFRDDGASGQFWFATQSADLRGMLAGVDLGGYAVDSGNGDLAAWLDWQRGKVVRDLFQFDLRDLSVTNPAGVKVSVPAWRGVAELARSDQGYTVRWAGSDGSVLRADLDQFGTPQARLDAVAGNLQLAPLLPWLGLKPGLAPGVAQWLAVGQPHGRVQHAVLHWSAAAGLQMLDATFDNLGIAPVGKLPGVDALRGEVRGDAQAVSLQLPAQATSINLPHSFRQPFAMSRFSGDFAFWRDADATHIGIAQLDFEGQGYGGNAQGEIQLPVGGGRPFLDIYAAVTHADVTAAKLFWPVDSTPPPAVAWLDQAFVAGTMDADVVLRGNLADWPFHHNEGRFEARADINDLTLSYGKSWPAAEHIQAVANFIDAGLLVQASSGDALGVKISNAVAVIPELAHTVLDLNVSGNGNAADLLNFVAKSPIASKHADVLAKLQLGGTGNFDFHLSLPMHDMQHSLLLDGSAQLQGVDVNAPEWNLQLSKLSGPAGFDAHGFHAGPLAGGFRGEPSQVDLAIAQATGDPNTVLAATINGSYTVQELLQGYSNLKWLGDVADGRSQFTIGYQIAHASDGGSEAQTLSIDSPMSGVALNFPVPLNKGADSSMPMHVSMGLPTSGSMLQIAMGSVMRGRLRLAVPNQSPLAATFAFGDQMPDSDTLPAQGMRIRGDAPELDVTGWVKQSIGGSAATNGLSLETIDVSTAHAEMFGRDFNQMHITALPKGDTLELDVDSQAAAGHFSVPTRDLNKRGVTARLQRMYWPKEPTAAPKKPGAPAAPSVDPADTGIDPSAMPPQHIWVHDLRLGDTKLGEARLETWPTATGMHIDQLSTQAKSVQLNASGDWSGSASNSSTHLRVNFGSDNIGDMLTTFGYRGLFEGGKTQAELNATWPGGPWSFELGNMDGTLKVDVTHGSIPKASPGVTGRFFGLASIVEFPRRLSLDFGDVFGKGFGFDSITGDFRLKDGNAVTHNLKVKGPAADISVSGRTGLRARDYDQQVVVLPHVGSSLPVVGAVIGGPIGAAAGFAVQGVLGRGLSHVATQRYHVGGSWDKPVITSGGSTPAPAASAPASAAPAAAGSAP